MFISFCSGGRGHAVHPRFGLLSVHETPEWVAKCNEGARVDKVQSNYMCETLFLAMLSFKTFKEMEMSECLNIKIYKKRPSRNK